VEKEVLKAFFSCDLHECRGACCVEGELGAPLSADEAKALQALPEELLAMLPERGLLHLHQHGAVELYQGVHYTKTVDHEECIFATVRDGITFCAIEIAHREGIIEFDKPISCRLFPIRVRKKFGLDYLVYEQHSMCRAARAAGRERTVKLLDYLSPALALRFGGNWMADLKAYLDASFSH